MENKLAFAANGEVVLYSPWIKVDQTGAKERPDTCSIWSFPGGERRGVVPGKLVGVSRNGASFITRNNTLVMAWRASSVEPLSTLPAPEEYAIDQRVFIRREMMEMRLHLHDALAPAASRVYKIPPTRRYRSLKGTYGVTEAALSPCGRRIVLVVAGEAGGCDWAVGQALDAETGKHAYDFEVNRFTNPRPAFSPDTFIMPTVRARFDVYDTLTGASLRHFQLRSFGTRIAVSPRNPYKIAAGSYRWRDERRVYYVELIDVGPPIPGKRRGRPLLREPAPVEALCFSPDGAYLATLLTHEQIHLWNVKDRQRIAAFNVR